MTLNSFLARMCNPSIKKRCVCTTFLKLGWCKHLNQKVEPDKWVVVARDKDGGPWQIVSEVYDTEAQAIHRRSEISKVGLYVTILTQIECQLRSIE
jgi:hypothetical protein